MNTKRIFYDVEMFIISFGIATFTLGYTYFLLLLALYLIIRNLKIKIQNNIIIWFFLILAPGTIFALYVVIMNTYGSDYTSGILLRTRFFWIRLFFIFGVLTYVSSLKYEEILKFVYYISIPLTITGIFQFLSDTSTRVSMLTSEPSAAGMYYVFMSPLLFIYYKLNRKSRFWIVLFLIVGVFIRSKAQILATAFFIFYFVLKTKNKKFRRFMFFLILLVIIISPILLNIREIENITRFYTVLTEKGIGGLNYKNYIYSSFTTRFSSFLTAIQLFYENLLGTGFGVFHPEYIHRMTSPEFVQSQMSGSEIRGTLKGELYSTPKSIFFEYLVSAGLFFLLPLLTLLWKFHKQEKSELIKASCYGLLVVSLMVELAPFLLFIIIIFVLFYKKKEELENALTPNKDLINEIY